MWGPCGHSAAYSSAGSKVQTCSTKLWRACAAVQLAYKQYCSTEHEAAGESVPSMTRLHARAWVRQSQCMRRSEGLHGDPGKPSPSQDRLWLLRCSPCMACRQAGL